MSSDYHLYNVFGHIIDIEKGAVKALTHSFFEKNSLSFAQIIKSIVVHNKNMKFKNIVLLDTPGYTKSERFKRENNTDESVARKHLKEADYLIWLVDIASGTIPATDIELLEN